MTLIFNVKVEESNTIYTSALIMGEYIYIHTSVIRQLEKRKMDSTWIHLRINWNFTFIYMLKGATSKRL